MCKVEEDNRDSEDLDEGGAVVDPLRELNNEGFTPLLVAVEQGHRHMVHAIVESLGEVQWAFGRVKCTHYPLTYFDRACMQVCGRSFFRE